VETGHAVEQVGPSSQRGGDVRDGADGAHLHRSRRSLHDVGEDGRGRLGRERGGVDQVGAVVQRGRHARVPCTAQPDGRTGPDRHVLATEQVEQRAGETSPAAGVPVHGRHAPQVDARVERAERDGEHIIDVAADVGVERDGDGDHGRIVATAITVAVTSANARLPPSRRPRHNRLKIGSRAWRALP
jgi:hypothetical protein